MVFHQYAGNRIVRAHGAAAKPLKGNHGLIAGCSYAKDILKAFLIPTAGRANNTTFRDYVDDMTIIAVAKTPEEVANTLLR